MSEYRRPRRPPPTQFEKRPGGRDYLVKVRSPDGVESYVAVFGAASEDQARRDALSSFLTEDHTVVSAEVARG